MTVVLYSEGRRDLGSPEPFAPHAEPGPLRVLVGRVLGDRDALYIETRAFGRVHGTRGGTGLGGFARKTCRALRDAKRDGDDAVVIVVDRDGHSGKGKLAELLSGRDAAAVPVASAIGVAQEMVESWLMGDATGWRAAYPHADPPPADPETDTGDRRSERYAKKVLEDLLEPHRDGKSWVATYTRLAEHIDLRRLEETCHRSFAPFAAELRNNVGPCYGVRPSDT